MARLLLLVALFALVFWTVRRVLSPRSRPGARRDRGGDQLGAPDQLVCGACGVTFDADEHGWICPKCGK
jgi:hypothetical protein